MFGVVFLTPASSARLRGARNSFLERISIAIFLCWTCEQKTVVNKLQFNLRKYRYNLEVGVINSYLKDGRTVCHAEAL